MTTGVQRWNLAKGCTILVGGSCFPRWHRQAGMPWPRRQYDRSTVASVLRLARRRGNTQLGLAVHRRIVVPWHQICKAGQDTAIVAPPPEIVPGAAALALASLRLFAAVFLG